MTDWPVLTAMSIRDKQIITEAVLAERERCAKIAERYKTVYAKGPKAIAAAIRREAVSVRHPDITVRSRMESEQNSG